MQHFARFELISFLNYNKILSFLQDRRLTGLRYDYLTKSERARYRSAKRLTTYLRNIFRCMALHNLASKSKKKEIDLAKSVDFLCIVVSANLLYILEMKIRASSERNSESTNIDFQRFFSNPLDKTGTVPLAHQPSSSTSKTGLSTSDGSQLLKSVKPHIVWLPEMTLSVSLTTLIKTINQDNPTDRECYIEEHVTASLIKQKGRLPRFIRYKELIEMATSILRFYKMEDAVKSWSFSSFCYECGKSFGVFLMACPGCQMVSYCTKNCKTENWRKGHKDECPKLEFKAPSKTRSTSSKENVALQQSDKTVKKGKGQKLKSKSGV